MGLGLYLILCQGPGVGDFSALPGEVTRGSRAEIRKLGEGQEAPGTKYSDTQLLELENFAKQSLKKYLSESRAPSSLVELKQLLRDYVSNNHKDALVLKMGYSKETVSIGPLADDPVAVFDFSQTDWRSEGKDFPPGFPHQYAILVSLHRFPAVGDIPVVSLHTKMPDGRWIDA